MSTWSTWFIVPAIFALLLSPAASQPRIVGGEEANIKDYPFFVEVDRCGASLIWSDIVLTAAHCGEKSLRNSVVTIGGDEARKVSSAVPHPDWDKKEFYYNDFMVLVLDEPSTKRPIELNDRQRIPQDNEELTVIGYGNLYYQGPDPTTLMKVNVQAMSNSECQSKFDSVEIDDTMLCANDDNGGKGICNGDSGGPLFTSGGVQVGVVSAVSCAETLTRRRKICWSYCLTKCSLCPTSECSMRQFRGVSQFLRQSVERLWLDPRDDLHLLQKPS